MQDNSMQENNNIEKEDVEIGQMVQIAGRNGHLCHIRRTPKDIISGQPRTY